MEGKMKRNLLRFVLSGAWSLIANANSLAIAQESSPNPSEIALRKSVNTRQFQGKEVEGEDRQIGPGDSLWRILVEEKGVPGKQFRSYVVIIRGLNPQIKNLEVLRVGDKIFIPLRAEQLLKGGPESGPVDRIQPGKGPTNLYRVKAGEHLYQILREQLKLTDERRVAQYYALVKDLNPERKSWDTLLEGETIRLPIAGRSYEAPAIATVPMKPIAEPAVVAQLKSAPEAKPAPEVKPILEVKPAPAKTEERIDRRQALRSPAKENMALFARVAEAMGSQLQQSGEEVIAIKDGAVRFDKKTYPVVYNPILGQRVVLDPEGNIPAALRSKLGEPSIGAAILPMANGVSIQDAVSQLLSGLGYQALATDRPVVIQEDGVAYEAKGNWMALAPEEGNKPQQVFIINVTDDVSEIPDYLKALLVKKGLHLKDVLLPSSAMPQPSDAQSAAKDNVSPAKVWPRDKKEIVDALLLSFGVPFGVAETLSVELHSGLRIDTRIDRIFELGGKRTALFFQPSDPDIKKTLQDKEGVRSVDIEIGTLSSREIITRLINLLGDPAAYGEHRFAAASGAAQERLTVTAWGFHLPKRSLFITDRPIPAPLHRFFFEKGLEIVYFQ
jgi:hypothetical protein